MKEYEMIVIGSGGGTKLVSPVAAMGKKVAIIEKESLGGTCLNRGCIPSKMLIHVADLVSEIEEANDRFEITTSKPQVDFPSLVKRVNETIDKESNSIEPGYERNPHIDLYKGHGRFISDHAIEVNGEILKGDKILIATGADAHIPNIKGLMNTPFITYRQALRDPKLPKSMVVLGSGYIATELGYFYAKCGCEVTFLVRSSFIKQEDQEIIEVFTQEFERQFNVVYGVPNEVKHNGEEFSIHVHTHDGKEAMLHAESFLVATGVVPNTHDLGLEHTSVQLCEKGYVKVNDYLQTNSPSIYALGDCIGRYFFRHNANFEGEYLFHHLYHGEDQPIHYHMMPHAVFTNPQVASVGLTEQKAKEKGIDYLVGKCPYKKSAMGMALRSECGLVKLIFESNELRLIGAHIVGYEASIMIHMLIAYIQMNGSLYDLLETIYIHPALCEIVRNAARDAAKNIR